jgi:hypothetical protein
MLVVVVVHFIEEAAEVVLVLLEHLHQEVALAVMVGHELQII